MLIEKYAGWKVMIFGLGCSIVASAVSSFS